MVVNCKGIFIIGAKRTPFCKYGGLLRELPASHAFAAAAREAISSANLDPAVIDSTVIGNVHYLSQCDGGKTPRYCGIYSGVAIEKPALGVNKACGSGLQAITTAAQDILAGASNIVLTGGTETMSAMPFLVRNVRFGTKLGSNYFLEDNLGKNTVDSKNGMTLEKIFEDLTKKYDIKREDVDEFCVQSRSKWCRAQNSKTFDEELTTMKVKLKNEEIQIKEDETSFPNDFTASHSSLPADGAASLILASEEATRLHNLRPLARLTGWSCVGVHPRELGVLPAIESILKNNDVQLLEINETFASEVLITTKTLKINADLVNVDGGSLAVGNPTAATGARMAIHLIHELRRRNLKRGIAASNCGGGQGVSLMLEIIS